MAKKKNINNNSNKKDMHFGALGEELQNALSDLNYSDKVIKITYLGEDRKILQWGKNNQQPFLLDDLANKGGWHASCLSTNYKFGAGRSLRLIGPDGNEVTAVPAPNRRGDSYDDIWNLGWRSYVKYGWYGLEFANRLNGTFDQAFFRKGSDLRVEVPDQYGVVPGVFLSKTWKKKSGNYQYNLGNGLTSDKRYISLYHPDNDAPSQIILAKQLSEESEVYPSQWYFGAADSILLMAQISNAKNSFAYNAAALGAILLIPKDLAALDDGETAEDILADYEDELTGSVNAGKTAMVFYKPGSDTPSFINAPELRNHKAYDDWETQEMYKIFSHHGILFPELAGMVNENTGLGTEDVMAKFQIFFDLSLQLHQKRALAPLDLAIQRQLGPGYSWEIVQYELQSTQEEAPEEGIGTGNANTTN